ncbi:hypothetical protein JTE90_013467 [Oedothorax gibbosus]|uniref:BHLH domain-containing protein n=1 Tax=Oedothorax gibbosus TaxID=931172 RepID=A0AAV6VKJ8_9ARAC|nr:hypothetical protein JTE90_013467 [Oedothorax gibbosus]
MFDEEEFSLSSDSLPSSPPQPGEEEQSQAYPGLKIEKRQYHNLLERNRRNVLKYSFSKLRTATPVFAKRNARASRAKILKRSIEFIRRSEQKRAARDKDIKDLRAENKILEDQIRAMESVNDSTNLNVIDALLLKVNEVTYKERIEEPSDTEAEDSSSSDEANEENENDPDAAFSDDDIGDQNRAPQPQVAYPVDDPESESETEDSTSSSDSSD